MKTTETGRGRKLIVDSGIEEWLDLVMGDRLVRFCRTVGWDK